MSVRKRGNKWTARIYIGDAKWKWLGSFDTEEAATKAFEFARDSRATELATIEAFADRWLREYNHVTKGGRPRWGEATLVQYRDQLKALTRPHGRMRMIDFRITDARTWALEQPLAYVRVAAAMFADARRDELVPQNPFEKLRLQQPEGRKNIVCITEAELERLCVIAQAKVGPVFEAMVAVCGYCMLRPGEIFALRRDAIDFRQSIIHVRAAYNKVAKRGDPKTAAGIRIVYMPHGAARRLAALPEPVRRDALMFTNNQGRHFRQPALHNRWMKVVHAFEASLPEPRRRELQESRRDGKHMDFYELRHFGATERLRRGAAPIDVAREMGHTDDKLVLRLYGHPEDEHRISRMRAVFEENVAEIRPVDEEEKATG